MSDTVTFLDLNEKNISGTIPSAICQIEFLISINLSNNDIWGYMPVGLYNCSNLEYLDLSLNKLSGAIPGELFLIKRLSLLDLHGNILSGDVPMPTEAHGLEILDLSDNHLTGKIPDDIRNLHNLVRLDLSKNALTGTTRMELFHMHQLCNLSMAFNNLSGSLSAVDLSGNQLSGDIIDSLFDLRVKRALRLCSNKFSGKVPYDFVKQYFGKNCLDLSNLCSDNRIEGLQSCPSCLDDRIPKFTNCNSKNDVSKRHVVIIIPATIGTAVVGFMIIHDLARKCRITTRCKKLWQSGPQEEKEEWKMISFQRLKFNKNEILSGLRDENLIGDGGSGKVYRVFINQTGKSVAVKSISNASKSDHRLEKEFMAEIQTVGNVRHYNIVKLLCCISGKDLKLLVYQYFENKSLDQWLHCNGSRLDWPIRLHIATGVARGLCYLHHDCSPPGMEIPKQHLL